MVWLDILVLTFNTSSNLGINMSRTYKDRPSRIRYPLIYPWRQEDEEKPKQKKNNDTEWHWMSTPGWWISMMMSKPERKEANSKLRGVMLEVDLEEVDIPDTGRKPHIYYF